MAKHSKAYRAAVEKIGDATYAPLEAFAMVKEVATTKFDRDHRGSTSAWVSIPVRLISSCVVRSPCRMALVRPSVLPSSPKALQLMPLVRLAPISSALMS